LSQQKQPLATSSSTAQPLAPWSNAAGILGALGTGVATVSADWKISYANDALLAALGLRAEECAGRDLRDAMPAIRGHAAEALARATMEDGLPRVCRVPRHHDRDDEVYEVRVSRAAGGPLVVELRDVSAAARLEREHERAIEAGQDESEEGEENASLRELARAMSVVTDSAMLLRALAEAARSHANADGAAVLEIDGDAVQVLATAGGAARNVGDRFPLAGSLTERAMRSHAPVMEENIAPLLAQQLGAAAARAGPALVAPLVAHHAFLGALAVTRRAGAAPFSERDAGRLQVIADYAALVLWKAHLLEEARAANQAKSNFLATISHELRTPLTALTGYGELLADEIMGELSATQHEVIERMRSVTHHLTMMIDEILTFSSLEAGREKVRPAEVATDELVRAASAVVEPLARQKEIAFVVTASSPARTLVTDADKVRQILVNLAGNAVKFTDQGSVRLDVENGQGTVSFTVRDTGIGITPEDGARLFQPFSQVDTGLTRRHGGTGLGLYISQRLAQLLGGRIDFESTPGEGSTFTLTVPEEYQEGA
jgi:signal transduction histidine kinase